MWPNCGRNLCLFSANHFLHNRANNEKTSKETLPDSTTQPHAGRQHRRQTNTKPRPHSGRSVAVTAAHNLTAGEAAGREKARGLRYIGPVTVRPLILRLLPGHTF